MRLDIRGTEARTQTRKYDQHALISKEQTFDRTAMEWNLVVVAKRESSSHD